MAIEPQEWDPRLVELMYAAVREPERARALVVRDPELVRLRTPHVGETALHYLAIENYADAVKLLIELGADMNSTNHFGDSALHDATRAGATEAAAVLRAAGAVVLRDPADVELDELRKLDRDTPAQ
jgi:hypothetical protein